MTLLITRVVRVDIRFLTRSPMLSVVGDWSINRIIESDNYAITGATDKEVAAQQDSAVC